MLRILPNSEYLLQLFFMVQTFKGKKKKCRHTSQESVQVIAAWNLRKKRLLVSEHKDVIAVASESLACMSARIHGVCTHVCEHVWF